MTLIIVSLIAMIGSLFDSLLPTFDLTTSQYASITSGISSIVDFLKQVNFLIPLPDIMLIITLDLSVRIFKLALFAGNWILRRILDVIP